MVDVLSKSHPPKHNLSNGERKQIRSLAKRKDLLVFLADMGKAVVMMDTQEYKDKIKAVLTNERVYKRLKHDPTGGYKEKLIDLITGFKDQGKIFLDQYRDLYPTLDLVLQQYGSPKIHKKGNPLRLITDYVGSSHCQPT